MSFVFEQSSSSETAIGEARKPELLLQVLLQMQECEDIGQFCENAILGLERIFGKLAVGLFITTEPDRFSVAAASGYTILKTKYEAEQKIKPDHWIELNSVLRKGECYFTDEVVILSLVRGEKILGALYLETVTSWHEADMPLLEQFSKNVARGFETTYLLQEAETLAYKDHLTSLGNRLSFKKEIQNRIIDNEDSRLAVLQFVLDDLPELNIALGHSTGDKFIRNVAEQLSKLFPTAITLARTSGDGFGVCIERSSDHEVSEMPSIINDLFDVLLPDVLKMPHLSPRMGISLYPEDGDQADRIWQNTNIALASTRKAGSPNFCHYDKHIEAEIHGRVTLNNALREGMGLSQLSLNYQPQICLETGKMVGVEALLRWERSAGQFVPADVFIPIAEASGLLGPISEWVLREACSQRKKWTMEGVEEFPVAVNISLKEFQSEEFVPLIQQVLDDTGLPAEMLDIELTESVIMLDRGQTKRNMLRLKEMGVRLSIDDFGTGYSSLSYLSHLPASVLKIDKSFIDGVMSNSDDAAIAKTIITLGNNLGMRVLAEGVENLDQVKFLQEAGCHEAQGFIFSKPVPKENIPTLSKNTNFLI
ncbi:MAG: EAL domain-containing protein [Sneathiella sp.]|nr:EAL domain-containing protein [Sneathiella sp.]